MSDSIAVAAQRLVSHRLANNALASPAAVVAHLGAVQAQDYLAALWAIGVRMKRASEEVVERAVEERRIVRCWPMRGTQHFVAAEDARWMLELLAPGVLARHRTRLERDFELDAATLRKCRAAVEQALRGGKALTRAEIYAALEWAKIAMSSGRGMHVIFALAHERLICFGPRRGKQPTFVLLDEWLPPAPSRDPEEARVELARRYLRGHGPATVADFSWWSGLTPKQAREAMDAADVPEPRAPRRASASVHLLPPFDEYTVAYRDRTPIADPAHAKSLNAGGGMISAVLLVNGRVAGTWKRVLRGKGVAVVLTPLRELSAEELRGFEAAVERYARFLGVEDWEAFVGC